MRLEESDFDNIDFKTLFEKFEAELNRLKQEYPHVSHNLLKIIIMESFCRTWYDFHDIVVETDYERKQNIN